MSPFDPYRNDRRLYDHLLNADPRRHPWRRWGWTPNQIAVAQQRERARLRGVGDSRGPHDERGRHQALRALQATPGRAQPLVALLLSAILRLP